MSRIHFRRLEKYQIGQRGAVRELAMPLPRTATGKVDRQCPRSECTPGRFQVGEAPSNRSIAPDRLGRARRPANAQGTTCPYCGHDDDGSAFISSADRRAAIDHLRWAAREDVADALGSILDQALRGMKGIKLTRSSRRRSPPSQYREDLLRDVTCDTCARAYGVYGLALFCPDCGASNILVHLDREHALVKEQLALLDLAHTSPEHRLRSQMNGLEDVISSLEAILKAVYVHVVRRRFPSEDATRMTSKKSIGTKCQNPDRARELYSPLGMDPFGCLNADELSALQLAQAQRNVVTHNTGLVDEAYVTSTGQGHIGQSFPLSLQDVARAMSIACEVVIHLERSCPELTPKGRAPGAP